MIVNVEWMDIAKGLATGAAVTVILVAGIKQVVAIWREPDPRAEPERRPTCHYCTMELVRVGAMELDKDGRSITPDGAEWVCWKCDPIVYYRGVGRSADDPTGKPAAEVHPMDA